jgi:hypothetical protein
MTGPERGIGLAVIGVGFVAAAAWVVHAEGEAYRHALRQRRALAAARRIVPKLAPTSIRAPEPEPARTPRPEPPTQTAARPTAPAVREAPRAPAPAAKPDRTPQTVAEIKLPALFVPDVANLPTAEEARLGKLLYMLILANHGADEDSPYQRAIVAATRPIVDLRDRQELEITITVLDSNEVNAFSHLGGYIYVTRGLFNLAATEEEFRFVVGHELAHVDRKHAQSLVDEAARRGRLDGVGTLQALYHQIAAGYTEAQEYEADDWVVARMLGLDHTKLDCLRFLRKLVKYSEDHEFRGGSKPPKAGPGDTVQDVDNHVRSQPAAWKRLARLDERLKRAEAPPAETPRAAVPRR